MNGLATGSIYALVTLGLALVYGIMRILHVAHAAVYTIGAYMGLLFFDLTGSLFLAVLGSMAVCALVGVAIERFIYFPLLKYPPFVPLIASIAILLVGRGAVPAGRRSPDSHFQRDAAVSGVSHAPASRSNSTITAVYCITAAVLLLLWFITTKTELGLAMRAASQDMAVADAMGINSHLIISITFVIGSAIAAVAGILVGIYFNQVYPTMGAIPAYKTLALIVVGGLGSVPGAVVASLLLGMAETLLIGYANIPLPRDALAFIAMIGMLMWRSQGLLGSR